MVGKKQGHAQAVELAQLVSTTAPFLVLDSSSELRQAALDRFATLPPAVSYTDAVVMATADAFTTTRIFGFDTDHARAGYRIIGSKEGAEAA